MVPQNCHPDRSGAQWRDLLFLFRFPHGTFRRILRGLVSSRAARPSHSHFSYGRRRLPIAPFPGNPAKSIPRQHPPCLVTTPVILSPIVVSLAGAPGNHPVGVLFWDGLICLIGVVPCTTLKQRRSIVRGNWRPPRACGRRRWPLL
jgi:hypothetical protein